MEGPETQDGLSPDQVERCISSMQAGTQMVKLRGGSKGLVRFYYLDEHKSCIRWRPSRKNEKAKISIDSVQEVCEGKQSEIFQRYADGSFDPNCCFSIYYGDHMESLDLVSSNGEEARTWITGLRYLMAGISDEDSLSKRQRTPSKWLKQTFDEADKNGDGSLSINEVLQLLHKLNVNLPRQKVKQMFKEADTDDNQGTLGFDEFCAFYKMMSTRRDLYLLMLTYSNHKDHLDTEDLKRFLEVEQKMTDVTKEYCLNIIDQFEPCLENKSKEVLGIDGFTNYTRSPEGDIFNPKHYQVNQDMTYPLSYYFITSSHNTYLIGDQLMSQSRVDMYSWVLQAGCRCVEVDCWDGPDGEPIVHHGYTLTSKILFKDVIETINKYAFIKNEYPVILSIENHCSVLQQKKMAQYLIDILGDKLDLSTVSSEEDSTTLPSPEKLKGKILVKGKKLPANISEDAEEGDVSDEDSADEIDDDCKLMNGDASTNRKRVENIAKKKLDSLIKESKIRDCEDPNNFTVSTLPSGKLGQKAEGKKKFASLGASATDKSMSKAEEDTESGEDLSGSKRNSRLLMSSFSKRKKKGSKLKKTSSIEEGDDDLDSQGSQSKGINRQKKTMKLSRALSDLVKYTKSVGIHDVETEISSSWQVSSFSETKAHQILQQKPAHYLRFNQHQLSRIYPSSYRVDSSNYNPQPFWNAGCQMVALNYQSEGRMLQLNRAKFNANGNCGYVLKPQCMCQGIFNPNSEDPLPGQLKKQLILRIISGQQLPKPRDSMLGDRGEIIDPFVEVEIIGLPVDCNKEQTRVVDDNGFNPMWEETLVFTVHMPEIALVRFLVWDHDPIGRDFIGQRTLAFNSMMPGYRHVYLEGMEEASIFVHVAINDISGKVKQALGLKGLFLRNPKQASLDSHAAGQFHNRPSISGQLLRRTASAPTKSQKKNKKGFPELTMDTKEHGSEAAGEDTSQPRFDSEPESAALVPGALGEGPGRGPKDGRPFSIQRSVSSLYSLETIAEEPLVAKETPSPAPCPPLPPAPISDSDGGSHGSAGSGSDTPLSSPSPGGPRTNGPGGLTAPGPHPTEGRPEGGERESRRALPTSPAGQAFLPHPSPCAEEPDGAAQRAERTGDPPAPRRPVGSVPLSISPTPAWVLVARPTVVRRAKSEGLVVDHLVVRRAPPGQSPAAFIYSDATGSDQLWSKLEPGSHRDSMSSSSSMSSNDTVIDLSMPNLVRKSLPNLGSLAGSREKLGGLAAHQSPWPHSAASGGSDLPLVTKSKSNPNLRAGMALPPAPDELQPRPLARRPEDALASLRRRPTWSRLYMEGLRAEGACLRPRAQDAGAAAKSKSLGDLTSDDFAPGFESTYRSISRSFGPRAAPAAGPGRPPGARLQAGPRDELTEQLRRLTGFQQAGDITSPTSLGPAEDEDEDEGAAAPAGPGPGFLRRSSSRSQSRVRYIATRARQAQERQRLQGLGVQGPLEERGNPEGACSVSREACVDSLARLIPPSKLAPDLLQDSHSGPVLLKL
ncbi:1-phosphatidylinositol 4,5-bisphosphate phosphodiesterase eta-2 [Antechinus flavipes]|uniref:1-phosphatidylinositol 4,5-bisphosphate phosphodiesterase eta-2 n=1 Tax=Antechinus flavipes TaxID=38775 RepID=UPI0022362219|nr:1-phosphatidylinositol 4,5-bisphosphate phosphodiesterase eta-2 [Antechinus flavipes]